MSLRIALTHVYAWPEVRRGGERYLHEFAAALADAGHDVRILSTAPVPSRGRVLGVETRYLRRGGRVMSRRFGELGDEVAFGMQSFARLASSRIDVWHAFGTGDAAAAALAGRVRGFRTVYTDLGVSERHWREQRPDRRLYHVVLRDIDRYLCLSHAAASCVTRDYGRRVEVLGGGVDLRAFAPGGPRHPAPVLLFPSAYAEPRKNFPLLLRAVALLRARRPSLELWLCGPGDPTPFLADAPAEAAAAAVTLGVGTPAGLADLYRRAWATVLPSRGEAFGLVLLESLACGTPVVALSDGGPAELVHPGVGAVCDPTPESLAEACAEALDLAAAPGIAGLCRAAAAAHDWRGAVVPRAEEIYCGPGPDGSS